MIRLKKITGLLTVLALVGLGGFAYGDEALEAKIKLGLEEMKLEGCNEGLSHLVIEGRALKEGHDRGMLSFSEYMDAMKDKAENVRWGLALDCAVSNSSDYGERKAIVDNYVDFYLGLVRN